MTVSKEKRKAITALKQALVWTNALALATERAPDVGDILKQESKHLLNRLLDMRKILR